jgi:hypothetical protein
MSPAIYALCRTVYFFLQGSPLQFKVCALFQLSIDFGRLNFSLHFLELLAKCPKLVIVAQRIMYGNKPPVVHPDVDDIEQALRLDEE